MNELARLPGIGMRSAERIAFHLLKQRPEDAMKLADAIRDVKTRIRHCSICFNLTEQDPCSICGSPTRDQSLVCVVEQPKDLLALESTVLYNGVYHVLLGRIAPLEESHPQDLTIDALVKRLETGTVREGDHGDSIQPWMAMEQPLYAIWNLIALTVRANTRADGALARDRLPAAISNTPTRAFSPMPSPVGRRCDLIVTIAAVLCGPKQSQAYYAPAPDPA